MAGAKSKTLLVLNRNYVLTTTKGHSIAFEKGKPTHVPPAIYQEALAIGALPPDGEEPQIEDVVKLDNAPSDPAERAPLILAAIEKLVAENARENFTAAGSPAVGAVSEVVGFKVQAKEVATVWQQYHDKKAAEKLAG
jgi:hypothetical protein